MGKEKDGNISALAIKKAAGVNSIKAYIEDLELQEAGWKTIHLAKETGTLTEMDAVENLVTPEQSKKYLSWLHNVKRQATRDKQIA